MMHMTCRKGGFHAAAMIRITVSTPARKSSVCARHARVDLKTACGIDAQAQTQVDQLRFDKCVRNVGGPTAVPSAESSPSTHSESAKLWPFEAQINYSIHDRIYRISRLQLRAEIDQIAPRKLRKHSAYVASGVPAVSAANTPPPLIFMLSLTLLVINSVAP